MTNSIRPSAHIPGSVPPINPHNINQSNEIVPFRIPTTTPNPLSQHIALQKRPTYEVVQVPENTIWQHPSVVDIFDNKQQFQINPILTNEKEGHGSIHSVLGGHNSPD